MRLCFVLNPNKKEETFMKSIQHALNPQPNLSGEAEIDAERDVSISPEGAWFQVWKTLAEFELYSQREKEEKHKHFYTAFNCPEDAMIYSTLAKKEWSAEMLIVSFPAFLDCQPTPHEVCISVAWPSFIPGHCLGC